MRPLQDLLNANPGQALGAGVTELITQTFNSGLGRYEFTGNQETDAVLIGSRWTLSNLTFSFPTSGTFYSGQGYAAGHEPDFQVAFNAAQQTAVRYALGLVASYTNLAFTEVTETASVHGNLRLSQTSYSGVGSAYGNFPSSSLQAGDIWFGMTGQPFYDTPAVGNWGQATIMHELGHTLGLKHGHDNYTSEDLAADGYLDHPAGGGARYGSVALPFAHDGQDWSLMTYRSDPTSGGADPTFEGDGFNQPQTYMQDDIAALQYLYGANFNSHSGNTTYSWNPTTGAESIDGVAQGAPTGNVILMTLWDGNGVDTYDLSNYTTNLQIDLQPGDFSTFSAAQLANHQAETGGSAPAMGNVANARLFQGDTRSLIENANGGSGSDLILGNEAANTLQGNGGADTLIGGVGNDILFGGSENDTLYGDGTFAIPSGVGIGSGQVIKPAGFGNSSLATALNVTNTFSTVSNPNIIDSTITPHATISGVGDGNKDYYAVTVAAGTTLTFDIDHTVGTDIYGGLDTFIFLYGPGGLAVAHNDDSTVSTGAGGSTDPYSSFLTYTVLTAGTYIIEVGQ